MQGRFQPAEHDNVELATAGGSVDAVNARFYGRFPYPPPLTFVRRLDDPSFEADMLSQSVGDWQGDVLPDGSRVWVAGCGRNQAVLTALRFPHAQVTGTDVSEQSLQAAKDLAAGLGVTNLELTCQSINDAVFAEEFDHVICTGVIHHNADPQATLRRISTALRPDGVLELMVYNRYHCVEAISLQKAVRILASSRSPGSSRPEFEDQLELARELAQWQGDLNDRVKRYFAGMDTSESAVADALIQPVVHTFTVQSLQSMAATCDLDLVLPCVNQFDTARDRYDWNLRIPSAPLRSAYEALDDVQRWQVTNLLRMEESPMLWFYLRKAGPRPRLSERELLRDFAEQHFEVSRVNSRVLTRTTDGTFGPVGNVRPYPPAPPDETCRRIVNLVAREGACRLVDVLPELGIPTDFTTLSELRARLTTTPFPYLRRRAGRRAKPNRT